MRVNKPSQHQRPCLAVIEWLFIKEGSSATALDGAAPLVIISAMRWSQVRIRAAGNWLSLARISSVSYLRAPDCPPFLFRQLDLQ